MQVKQIPGERRSQFEQRRKLLKQVEKQKNRGRLESPRGVGRAFRRKHPELFEEKTGED